MQIEVNFNRSANIFTVRKWGDPVLVDRMGSSTYLLPDPSSGNFQVVQTASFDTDGAPFFNCINRFQRPSYTYLESLQYPSDGFTVQQKMNWLVYYEGKGRSPYWTDYSPTLYFGPLVFGGQKVMLGETKTAWGKFPNHDKFETIAFRRLIGVRKSDFGKYTYQKEPWFIQRATATHHPNSYDEFPRGEIFHPVWSDLDYPGNYGDGLLWLAVDLLEEE